MNPRNTKSPLTKVKEIFAVCFVLFWCIAGGLVVYNHEKEPSLEQTIYTEYLVKEKSLKDKLTKEQITRPATPSFQIEAKAYSLTKGNITVVANPEETKKDKENLTTYNQYKLDESSEVTR